MQLLMKVKVSVLRYFTLGLEMPDCRLLTHHVIVKKEKAGTDNIITYNTTVIVLRKNVLSKLEKDRLIRLIFSS